MGSDKKKPEKDKKLDIFQEPNAIYETENNSVSNDTEELHPVLIQLIEKSKREIAEGKGISHEEAMRRIKLKFPFLK